jgi:hypothetical protein
MKPATPNRGTPQALAVGGCQHRNRDTKQTCVLTPVSVSYTIDRLLRINIYVIYIYS